MPLISVKGDPNSHGAGNLICDNNPGKAFINGKLIGLLGCSAASDNFPHAVGATNPSQASSKLFVGGIPVHLHGQSRSCGASTIVSGQSKVTGT